MTKLKSAMGRWVVGDDFFNRARELELLKSRVEAGNHVLVTGQRRMGKTSVLSVAQELPEFRKVCLPVKFYMRAFDEKMSIDRLLALLKNTILDEFENERKASGSTATLPPALQPFAEANAISQVGFLESFPPALLGALDGRHLPLMMDEFESLKDHPPDLRKQLLRLLVLIRDSKWAVGFVFVMLLAVRINRRDDEHPIPHFPQIFGENVDRPGHAPHVGKICVGEHAYFHFNHPQTNGQDRRKNVGPSAKKS